MNAGLDQNQTEFAVGVLAIAFQMLSDGNGFLDQIVQILWDVRFQTDRFHDAQNFVAADKSHLCNTMRITQDDTFIENANIKQTHSKNITSNYYRFEMGSCPSCPISWSVPSHHRHSISAMMVLCGGTVKLIGKYPCCKNEWFRKKIPYKLCESGVMSTHTHTESTNTRPHVHRFHFVQSGSAKRAPRILFKHIQPFRNDALVADWCPIYGRKMWKLPRSVHTTHLDLVNITRRKK